MKKFLSNFNQDKNFSNKQLQETGITVISQNNLNILMASTSEISEEISQETEIIFEDDVLLENDINVIKNVESIQDAVEIDISTLPNITIDNLKCKSVILSDEIIEHGTFSSITNDCDKVDVDMNTNSLENSNVNDSQILFINHKNKIVNIDTEVNNVKSNSNVQILDNEKQSEVLDLSYSKISPSSKSLDFLDKPLSPKRKEKNFTT